MLNIKFIHSYNLLHTFELLIDIIEKEGIVFTENDKEKYLLEYCIIHIEKTLNNNASICLPYTDSSIEEESAIIKRCFTENTNNELYDIGNRISNTYIHRQFSEKDELKSFVNEQGSVAYFDITNYEATIDQLGDVIAKLKIDPTIDNLILQINTVEDCKLNTPTILTEIGVKIIDNKVTVFPNFIKCNFVKEFFQYVLGVCFIQDFISKSLELENGSMIIQCRNLYLYTEELRPSGE